MLISRRQLGIAIGLIALAASACHDKSAVTGGSGAVTPAKASPEEALGERLVRFIQNLMADEAPEIDESALRPTPP